MTEELPEPLVPVDVDLRDFAFMPLDVQRLRDSDLASDQTPEACWAAVLLWCTSWHQVPAASVPDNDQWLAKQAGYMSRGRIDAAWAKVRAGAMRGWVKCSDGRLYHPVVAEKARDAWRSKLDQRWRTECSRIKKHNQRHNLSISVPEFEQWLSLGCPQGHTLPVSGDSANVSTGTKGDSPPIVPRETPSKGQGELKGEGQGQGDLKELKDLGAASPSPIPPPDHKKIIFNLGVSILMEQGDSEKEARAFLGKFAKRDPEKLAGIVGYVAANSKVGAKGYIAAAMANDVPSERL